jgi:hypothetical protein
MDDSTGTSVTKCSMHPARLDVLPRTNHPRQQGYGLLLMQRLKGSSCNGHCTSPCKTLTEGAPVLTPGRRWSKTVRMARMYSTAPVPSATHSNRPGSSATTRHRVKASTDRHASRGAPQALPRMVGEATLMQVSASLVRLWQANSLSTHLRPCHSPRTAAAPARWPRPVARAAGSAP